MANFGSVSQSVSASSSGGIAASDTLTWISSHTFQQQVTLSTQTKIGNKYLGMMQGLGGAGNALLQFSSVTYPSSAESISVDFTDAGLVDFSTVPIIIIDGELEQSILVGGGCEAYGKSATGFSIACKDAIASAPPNTNMEIDYIAVGKAP
jgi:hypothetical protein